MLQLRLTTIKTKIRLYIYYIVAKDIYIRMYIRMYLCMYELQNFVFKTLVCKIKFNFFGQKRIFDEFWPYSFNIHPSIFCFNFLFFFCSFDPSVFDAGTLINWAIKHSKMSISPPWRDVCASTWTKRATIANICIWLKIKSFHDSK